METTACSLCKIEKQLKDFYKKYTESEIYNSKRSLRRY